MDTLSNFIASADPCVRSSHVPPRTVSRSEVVVVDRDVEALVEVRQDLRYFNSPEYFQVGRGTSCVNCLHTGRTFLFVSLLVSLQ